MTTVTAAYTKNLTVPLDVQRRRHASRLVCLVVLVALGAEACTNPDTSSAARPEQLGSTPGEVWGAGSDVDEDAAAESAPRRSASAESEAEGVSDAADGSGASGGDRVEVSVVVERGDAGEDAASGDGAPASVDLPRLVETVAVAEGEWSAVTVGWAHACGLRTDGTVDCWGYNDEGQAEAPGGEFSAIAAGFAAYVRVAP